MPPRRSCFASDSFCKLVRSVVSMPPRRSCFHDCFEPELVAKPCFNATTAFLLPREAAEAIVEAIKFQCHHGVPASLDFDPVAEAVEARFNATTAFLLPDLRRG